MVKKVQRKIVAIALVSLSLLMTNSDVRASFTIDASVGGAPTGVSYANFDDLNLGSGGGTSGGIAVSFTGDGQTVQGSQSGQYAAPFLSGGNGSLFGDPNDGPDQTRYLTTGTGSVTLLLPGQQMYLGLLWGSVDNYNTLSLYNGNTLVATITGTDVTASADGNQGVNGTYYVNINSTLSFDKVVATSSSNAFEFDNVAFNPSAVPEPSSFVMAFLGGLGMLTYRQMHRKGLSNLKVA